MIHAKQLQIRAVLKYRLNKLSHRQLDGGSVEVRTNSYVKTKMM